MHDIIFGLAISIAVLIGLVGLVYFSSLIMLGWESHTKYGTGHYFVGGCLLGMLLAYFNYRHYQNVQELENVNYALWMLIISNLFLLYLGLWIYLIYHAIILKKTKALRSGSRLVKRVFAEESAPTGTGKFREQLKGWEGDLRLDMLIVEYKFSEAEVYLEGVIRKANTEMDKQKASHYAQYMTVIRKERLKATEESPEEEALPSLDIALGSDSLDSISRRRTSDIDKDELPEGWEVDDN